MSMSRTRRNHPGCPVGRACHYCRDPDVRRKRRLKRREVFEEHLEVLEWS